MARWVNGRKVEDEIRPPMGAGINSAGPPKGLYAPGENIPQGGSAPVPNRNAFTPWQPPPIPSGYYDPALDAQRQSASRGLVNTEQDIALALRRGQEDYGFGVGTLERNYARGVQDADTSWARTDADYNRNVSLLTRQFGQLARQQSEQARKYGVTSGGIALMSAARRAENQAIERDTLDTGYQRAGQDYRLGLSRMGEDRVSGLGELQRGYERGVADGGTALGRARTEDLFYGLDVDAQKAYQAAQAGYEAPARPSNEFVRPDGSVERVVRRDGWVYVYRPDGTLVSKRKAA